MCYDVPVKILSGHLLLLSLFLLLPNVKNLADIFCMGKVGEPFPSLNLFESKKFNRTLWCFIWVFLALYAAVSFAHSYSNALASTITEARSGDNIGFWYVDSCEYNGQPLPSSTSAEQRWQSLWVHKKRINVWNGSKWTSFDCKRANDDTSLELLTENDPSWKAHFSSSMPDAYSWILHGDVCGTPCDVHLHRSKRSDYLLLNRGFHWVNERPYNR